MKKGAMALTVIALALGSNGVSAQALWGGGGMRGIRAQRPAARGMALDALIGSALDRQNELALTDAQVSGLQELLEQTRAETAPLRAELEEVRGAVQDGSLERAEARERVQAVAQRIREAHQPIVAKLDELLTPEQRAHLAPRRGRMGRAGPAAGSAGARGQAMRRPLRRGGIGMGPGLVGGRGPGGGARMAPWASRPRLGRPPGGGAVPDTPGSGGR